MTSKNISLYIFFILSIVVNIILGLWQIERLQWKRKIINSYEKNIKDSYQIISITPHKERDLFKKVELHGRFDTKYNFYIFTVNSNYKAIDKTGYRVYTPFYTDKGYNIIVDRGWIPASIINNSIDKYRESDQKQKITGLLLNTSNKKIFTLTSNAKDNILTYLDLNLINKVTKHKFAQLYLYQDNQNNTQYPIKTKFMPNFHNFHALYAAIWFILAVVAMFFLAIKIKQQYKTVIIL